MDVQEVSNQQHVDMVKFVLGTSMLPATAPTSISPSPSAEDTSVVGFISDALQALDDFACTASISLDNAMFDEVQWLGR